LFCHEFRKLQPELQIEQRLKVEEDEIPEKLKTVIYRVFQVAMNNIRKHSNAKSV
jgi:signal transduction histidine kinase